MVLYLMLVTDSSGEDAEVIKALPAVRSYH